MTVAVVTPWHNRHDLAPDYHHALLVGPAPDETIIVDNASDPPLPYATIRNKTNRGFASASNQGLRAATADIVVFLNNDIKAVRENWLTALAQAATPGVLAGARLRNDKHAWVDDQPLPYLDGWCLAGTRLDLLDLGGFDETLAEPAYYSDNLLCLRARAAGMTLLEVKVGLRHKGNQTSRLNPAAWKQAAAANKERYVAEAQRLLVTA